jgi:hypothetical protein
LKKRTIALLGLCSLLIAAVGGWAAYARYFAVTPVPDRVLSAEQALAMPGLLALVAVNFESWVRLEKSLHGEPQAEALDPGEDAHALVRELHRAGIDPRTHIDHVVSAIYADPERDLTYAVMLFGSFEPARLEASLESSAALAAEKSTVAGKPVLEVRVRDIDTCALSDRLVVRAETDRLLLAGGEIADEILTRLDHGAAASSDLSRFQEFRKGQLASVALFIPESLPGIDNPIAAMGAVAAKEQLEGFRALYLGGGVALLPPGVDLEMALVGLDAQTAQTVAQKWDEKLRASERKWADTLSTVAELHDALTVEPRQNEVHLSAKLDRDWARNLSKVPGELIQLAFGGGGVQLQFSGSGSPQGERIDENPLAFEAHYPVSQLPAYDPAVPFASPVDTTIGPFGIQLNAIRVAEETDVGPEVEVKAIGTGLPNLGDQGGRARLTITSVKGRDGQELLRDEACGKERNQLPAEFATAYGSSVREATKTVRLAPGADPRTLAGVEGHVELDLPVRTESVRLSKTGETVSRGGAQLEITQLSGGSFSYHVSGKVVALLHVRALNAAGKPLARVSGSSMGSFLGNGSSGSNQYAGSVSQVEAVFVVEELAEQYPFRLSSIRPGTDGEYTASERVEFKDYSRERFFRQFAKAVRTAFRPDAPPRAVSRVGPFTVVLKDLRKFMGLMPEIEVRGPDIPNLVNNLSGLEIALRSIQTRDGGVHRRPEAEDAQWTQMLSPTKSLGEGDLSASSWLKTGLEVDPEGVRSIGGVLIVRLPQAVRTLSLSAVELGESISDEDVTVVVTGLGRDSFTLTTRGDAERVLFVRAFNGSRDELWMPHSSLERDGSGWVGTFSVKGVPARIDVIVAGRMERVDYGFSLEPDAEI